MTLTERTDAMIKAGAAIQLQNPNLTLLLAAARWGKGVVRWCAVYPEDQHHIHETTFARTTIDHDRDVLLYDKAGKLVAGIVPIAESPLDLTGATALLHDWHATLAVPGNAQEFADFFTEG